MRRVDRFPTQSEFQRDDDQRRYEAMSNDDESEDEIYFDDDMTEEEKPRAIEECADFDLDDYLNHAYTDESDVPDDYSGCDSVEAPPGHSDLLEHQ
jgi:hypothetical protein